MTQQNEPATGRELAALIDHTLLKPDASAEQIAKLCAEGRQYGFASVCVNTFWVPFAAEQLEGCPVKVAATVGFPLGAVPSETKAFEARNAAESGVAEIDMVMNVGALKSGRDDLVLRDIQAVVEAVAGKAIVKVILETGLLSDPEKINACEIAKQAGAHFVKTSTGFGNGGATVEDIRLMRGVVGNAMGVKASGGVRDYETAMAMINAGANRIGTSSGIQIVSRSNGSESTKGY